jgi:hypothetical protein
MGPHWVRTKIAIPGLPKFVDSNKKNCSDASQRALSCCASSSLLVPRTQDRQGLSRRLCQAFAFPQDPHPEAPGALEHVRVHPLQATLAQAL